jgi:hypothetical protein
MILPQLLQMLFLILQQPDIPPTKQWKRWIYAKAEPCRAEHSPVFIFLSGFLILQPNL